MSKNYETSHCVISSHLLSLPPGWVQISLSAPNPWTPSAYLFPLIPWFGDLV